ncbi:MAG: hypothetical protein H6733_11190 [Alphaproteobacteria bacterium]|nr:hypothetical protein [Alphaproteobacteria bacterium]
MIDSQDDDPSDRLRPDLVPNANSPQLLTHLLEMVARGVRSSRGLQEALGVDQRTVRYYVQAGVWLGWLVDGADPLLTPDGLGYVYAGASRREHYARAVADQPFVAALLARTGGRPPTDAELSRAISAADPSLAPSTVARRVSAVRGLIAPYLDHRKTLPEPAPEEGQLLLPLAQAPQVEPDPPLTKAAGRSFSPDIYRYVLCFLLDHGELTLGHVRGLLDRAGAGDVPIGGYVDLALERGDAVRVDERLVVTAGAVARRELAESTAAVILSDGGWRTHLDTLRAALATDAEGAVRATGRYRLWNRRLLGRELSAATLEPDLARVLRDRSLASWPRTTGAEPIAPPAVPEPFLDVWERPDLIVALPPSLVQLWEGVAGVNRRLRNARHRADAVGTPTVAYRPSVAHGGLLHPGEPLPRAVPDQRTLRQRLVLHAPYVALTVALLYLHRAAEPTLEIRHEDGTWQVRRQRARMGALLDVLDGFARSRSWRVSRRARGAVTDEVLVGLLDRLGLAVGLGDRLVLDDGFFAQLRHDDEDGLVRLKLDPLARALGAWVDGLRGEAGA